VKSVYRIRLLMYEIIFSPANIIPLIACKLARISRYLSAINIQMKDDTHGKTGFTRDLKIYLDNLKIILSGHQTNCTERKLIVKMS